MAVACLLAEKIKVFIMKIVILLLQEESAGMAGTIIAMGSLA